MQAVPKYRFVIAGKIGDANYHKCKQALEQWEQEFPHDVTVQYLGFFET